MTAIWRNDGDGWELAAPVGFPLEQKLHDLVNDAPHVLPLAGAPRVTVLGREVPCGSGYADLLAVEREGRLVLIEVKLASNAESRRAVVAQVLAYAAALRGLTTSQLDALLNSFLPNGCATVAEAVAASDQDRTFDTEAFKAALDESLSSGRFRLVLVLDSAPADLVRLVGYLETMTDAALVIDLVTVAQYETGPGGTQFLVPQRIEPDRVVEPSKITPAPSGTLKAATTDGVEGFLTSIDSARPEHQRGLHQLADWATSLEKRGLVQLFSTHGTSGRTTLIPRLRGYDAGLVTIANDNGPSIWMWRTVFDRFVPELVDEIETVIGAELRQGMTIRTFDETLLGLLQNAYAKAAR